MKNFLLAVLLIVATYANAQNYKITVGEEIKMKRGVSDLKIVTADNSGVFFAEGHATPKYTFMAEPTYTTTYKLIKFDKAFNEVYTKDYNKEMSGYEFHGFQEIGEELFLFATDYDKKGKSFKIYGVKINKNTGDFVGELTEIGSFDLESKKDDYQLKVELINNGKNFLTVVDISNADRTSLGVSVLDAKLNKLENTVINLSYAKDTYEVQDVKFTAAKKIVVLGKEFEALQEGNRKRTRNVFVRYAMDIYTNKGRKEKNVDLSSKDKFIIGGKLIEEPDGNLLLAGFYSNASTKQNLDGFFLNKLDIMKGQVLLASYKEINSTMLAAVVPDDDKAMQENKMKTSTAADDDEAFPNIYSIKSVDINPADNSYTITAEASQYKRFVAEFTKTTQAIMHQFTNSNILVIGADNNAKINWLNVVTKKQVEEGTLYGINTGVATQKDDYFSKAGGLPYYSSFKSLIHKNQLILLVNDHKQNSVNGQYGDKIKTQYGGFGSSNVYGITIDLASGKMTRKLVTPNTQDLVLMPRHSYVVNNEVYVPTRNIKMGSKLGFKMAKITIN